MCGLLASSVFALMVVGFLRFPAWLLRENNMGFFARLCGWNINRSATL